MQSNSHKQNGRSTEKEVIPICMVTGEGSGPGREDVADDERNNIHKTRGITKVTIREKIYVINEQKKHK